MALLSDYTAGTVSISGTTVTGVGTGWQTAGFQEGDWFLAEGYAAIVESVNSETELTVVAWAGPSITGGEYRLRYMSDGSRASAQARQLINMIGGSGSLEALAAISGVPGGIPYFTGPGTMGLLSQADITQGARYDVQVDTLAERDAYDSQPEGFAVLVNDIGDGRAAIYSRVGSVGNWTDPAYITGPIGPLPNVTVGGTSTGAPGTDADVVATPTVDGVELDFVIPRGRGITWRGEYDPGESYVLDDGVSYNGSTFIAIQEVPLAEPPSEVSAYWDVVAVKGQDGTGTGDVKGPSGGVTDGHIAVFDGTTGKLIRSAGKAPFSGDYSDLDNKPTLGDLSAIDLPPTPEGKLLDDSGNWIDPPESGGYDSNMALLALEMADLKGARMGMVGGVADPFDDVSGVNAGASSNYEHDDENHWFEPSAIPATSVFTQELGTVNTYSPIRNYRMVVTSSRLSDGGSFVRLRLHCHPSNTMSAHGITIGRKASSGNAWDIDDSVVPITEFKFGGVAAVDLIGEIVSDWLEFPLDADVDYVICVDGASTGGQRYDSTGTGATAYAKNAGGVEDRMATAPSGYTSPGSGVTIFFVTEIEVKNTPAELENMTLTSVAYPAATEPALGRLAVQLVEDDPITINDDVTAEISRDGGTNWSQATLALVSSLDSVKLYEDANIDMSGQPVGDDVVWRVKTDNNVDVAVSGVVAQWR